MDIHTTSEPTAIPDQAVQNLKARAFGSLLVNPIVPGTIGVTGAAGAQVVPTFLHEGGIAGRDGMILGGVHPAYFDDAPHFASGLNRSGFGINEVPAVLHRGELVGWPNQMRQAFGGGVSVGVNVTVNADNGMSNAAIAEMTGRQTARIVEQRLNQFRRNELPDQMAAINADPRSRGK